MEQIAAEAVQPDGWQDSPSCSTPAARAGADAGLPAEQRGILANR